MCALHQFRRVRRKNLHGLIQEGLRSRNQRRIGGLRHLASNDFLSLGYRRPMIVGQPQRHLDVKDVEQFNEVIRPARRNRAGAHGVFEGQIPANDPRENFAERRVRIGIGAACEGNHRGKLRVAERGKCAAQARKHEGEHQSGAGVVCAQSGKNEDAGADDGAHAECSELEHTQRTFQAMRSVLFGFRKKHAHWFGS